VLWDSKLDLILEMPLLTSPKRPPWTTQFDNFSGYSGSIVSQSEYDREDEDADKIYEAIDQRMQARRKRKRDEDDSKVCLLVILMFSPPSISLHIPPPPSPPFLSILTQPTLTVSHLY